MVTKIHHMSHLAYRHDKNSAKKSEKHARKSMQRHTQKSHALKSKELAPSTVSHEMISDFPSEELNSLSERDISLIPSKNVNPLRWSCILMIALLVLFNIEPASAGIRSTIRKAQRASIDLPKMKMAQIGGKVHKVMRVAGKIKRVSLPAIKSIKPVEPRTALRKDTKIKESRFKELLKKAKQIVTTQSNSLKCEANESGFVRINVPMGFIPQDIIKIAKLRLNFWAPNSGVTILEESIHTHPVYFESYVIRGGYTHELFASGEENDSSYDHHVIKKSDGLKSREYVGTQKLKSIKHESVQPGNLLAFPLSLIHRVKTTQEGTLTLNAVIPDDRSPQQQYSVFLTKNGDSSQVKTKRDYLHDDSCQQLRQEIGKHIDEFLGQKAIAHDEL